MQGATPKPWRSLHKLRQHFWDHGGEVGTADQAAYDASAQETVHIGRRFAYNDFDSGQSRVGYFDTTGEGRFLPDSQPEDAVEESSGFVVADDGQIFSYWLGWDPKDERPAFTEWEPVTPEPDWFLDDEFLDACRLAGYTPHQKAVQ